MPLLDLILTGGAAVALIGLLSKYLEYKWTKPKLVTKTSVLVIKAVADIYQSMNRVINESEVERVVIMKAENGGGKPKVGGHLYISAIMEVGNNSKVSRLTDYNRLKADAGYVELLADLLSKFKVSLVTDELADSLIKKIYLGEKVKYADAYFIHATDEAVYYCLFITNKDAVFNNPETALLLEVTVNYIANIFKTHL